MNTLLLYLLKANAVLVCSFLFYKLLIQGNTFHKWNRYFFLVSVLAIGFIPQIDYACWFEVDASGIIPIMRLDPNIKVSRNTTSNYENICLIFLCIGALFFLVRFLVQLGSLIYLHKKTRKVKINGIKISVLETESGPFSFFRWIFFNPNIHTKQEIDEIIEHESIHIYQLHTLDLLVYEFLTILFWYNPLVWIMRQNMRQNLEYLVDRQIINSGYNKRHYQYHLLKISGMHTNFEITSNFYFKHLKNRIMMMNRRESAHSGLLKYLLLIPVFAGMTLVLNAQDKLVIKKEKETKTMKAGSTLKEEPSAPVATIGFDKDVHDFGTVKEADGKVTAVFTFVNNGKTPLVVSRVNASCGCTTRKRIE